MNDARLLSPPGSSDRSRAMLLQESWDFDDARPAAAALVANGDKRFSTGGGHLGFVGTSAASSSRAAPSVGGSPPLMGGQWSSRRLHEPFPEPLSSRLESPTKEHILVEVDQGRAARLRATAPLIRRVRTAEQNQLLCTVISLWHLGAVRAAGESLPDVLSARSGRTDRSTGFAEAWRRHRRGAAAEVADGLASILLWRLPFRVFGLGRFRAGSSPSADIALAAHLLMAWRLQARSISRLACVCRRRATAASKTASEEAARMVATAFSVWRNAATASTTESRSLQLESERDSLEDQVRALEDQLRAQESVSGFLVQQLDQLARRHEAIGEHCLDTLRRADIWSAAAGNTGSSTNSSFTDQMGAKQQLRTLYRERHGIAAELQSVIDEASSVSQRVADGGDSSQFFSDGFELGGGDMASAPNTGDKGLLDRLHGRETTLRRALAETDRAIQEAVAAPEESLHSCLQGLQSHLEHVKGGERRRSEELRAELSRVEQEASNSKAERDVEWRTWAEETRVTQREREAELMQARQHVETLTAELDDARTWAEHLRTVETVKEQQSKRLAAQERELVGIKQALTELTDISAACFGSGSAVASVGQSLASGSAAAAPGPCFGSGSAAAPSAPCSSHGSAAAPPGPCFGHGSAAAPPGPCFGHSSAAAPAGPCFGTGSAVAVPGGPSRVGQEPAVRNGSPIVCSPIRRLDTPTNKAPSSPLAMGGRPQPAADNVFPRSRSPSPLPGARFCYSGPVVAVAQSPPRSPIARQLRWATGKPAANGGTPVVPAVMARAHPSSPQAPAAVVQRSHPTTWSRPSSTSTLAPRLPSSSKTLPPPSVHSTN